ncbi:MAG: FtsX-like permease family protein [Chloroflexi bacterium]|nr:FtsX-like permease family protein [Chloroflexota bacterium]
MLSPRWRKVFRDIQANLGQVALVVCAIAVGVVSVGWFTSSYGILSRELEANYVATNPASAILYLDDISPDVIESIQSRSDILDAEVMGMLQGRIHVDGEWRTFQLYVRQDYENTRINQLVPEDGEFPPPLGEILIERAALSVADADIGDEIQVQIENQEYTLPVAGTLHDLGVPPAWQENNVYAYATPETLTRLGIEIAFDELRITVAENAGDETHIRNVALDVTDWLESEGYTVFRVQVPPPLEHPNQNQMESLMMLLSGFGSLVFVLTAILVTNVMSAYLSKQVRQIAVMKAIGGRRGQITGLYVGMVLLFCALAALALPVGVIAGQETASFLASMLNFNIESETIPANILLLQVAMGLLVPLLAASYPIYRGTHVTVREALNDYGLSQNAFGARWFDRQLSRVRGVQRPLLLSLRNTFRQRWRLILTFSTLAIGGTLFMAALNVRASLLNSIDERYERQHYDIAINFADAYPAEQLESIAIATEGVVDAEAWGTGSGAIIDTNGTAGNTFIVLAPPAETPLVDWEVLEGRWLSGDIENGIVFNHALLAEYPDLQVGDEITLSLADRTQSWRLVGIVRETAAPPLAYIAYADFERATSLTGQAQRLMVVTDEHDEQSLIAAKQNLEASFDPTGMVMRSNLSSFDSRQIIEDHIVLITSFLVMAAALSLVVGGLGLMTTMGTNVLERTREIGVMRAIGASNNALTRIIVGEGVVIGLLSWLLAAVIVVPFSYIVAQQLGQSLLQTSLDFAVNPSGFVIWLGVVAVFSVIASWLPAWSANRLTVHDVLAYE